MIEEAKPLTPEEFVTWKKRESTPPYLDARAIPRLLATIEARDREIAELKERTR